MTLMGEKHHKFSYYFSKRPEKGGESGEAGVDDDDFFFGPEHRFYWFQRLFRGRIEKMAARFFSNFFKIAGLKSGDEAI